MELHGNAFKKGNDAKGAAVAVTDPRSRLDFRPKLHHTSEPDQIRSTAQHAIPMVDVHRLSVTCQPQHLPLCRQNHHNSAWILEVGTRSTHDD